MTGLSLLAIGAGVLAALAIGALAGAVMGLGVVADVNRARGTDEGGLDETEQQRVERALSEEARKPGFIAQMLALSVVSAALSGALTAWLAPAAPFLNAALVGLIGTALGALMARSATQLPPLLHRLGLLTTLPATLAGAWLVA